MPKKKTVNDLKSKIDIAQSELTLLEDKGNAGKKQLDEALEALEQISNRINEAVSKNNIIIVCTNLLFFFQDNKNNRFTK